LRISRRRAQSGSYDRVYAGNRPIFDASGTASAGLIFPLSKANRPSAAVGQPGNINAKEVRRRSNRLKAFFLGRALDDFSTLCEARSICQQEGGDDKSDQTEPGPNVLQCLPHA
jgi:hypothetical protein